VVFRRILDLKKLLETKSFFLFGARGTGKSFLIKELLSETATIINPLSSDLYLRLSANPSEMESMISAATNPNLVVIDEIQRVRSF
jgi:predicted AAA+ superfamily ATPase